MKPYGVMFHHFQDGDRHPKGQGAISAAELSQMIEFLGKDRILPAKEWLKRAIRGNLQKDHICLTFDDALRCQFDIAVPVLEHYGITAFWFVYSSVFEGGVEPLEVYRYFRTTQFKDVEDFYSQFETALYDSSYAEEIKSGLEGFVPSRYLTGFDFYSDGDRWFRFIRDRILGPVRYGKIMDQMLSDSAINVENLPGLLWMDDQCLQYLDSKDHVVGLHSYSHPTLIEKFSRDEQLKEYVLNKTHLTETLKKDPLCMSHPCNSYDTTTLEVLRECGIKMGFRANMKEAGKSEFEYPREDHTNILKAMVSQ